MWWYLGLILIAPAAFSAGIWFQRRHVDAWQRRREIYRFWDGKKWRYTDPLKMWTRYRTQEICTIPRDGMTKEEQDETDFVAGNVWDSEGNEKEGDPDFAARERVNQMICELFEVAEFDGENGLTIDELWSALIDFLEYMDDRKKKVPESPMQSPPTEATRSSGTESPTIKQSSELPRATTASTNSGPATSPQHSPSLAQTSQPSLDGRPAPNPGRRSFQLK